MYERNAFRSYIVSREENLYSYNDSLSLGDSPMISTKNVKLEPDFCSK